MTGRFFHIYADGKTVREISWEEWRKIRLKDYSSDRARLACRDEGTDLYFSKGRNFIWVRKAQLAEILGVSK